MTEVRLVRLPPVARCPRNSRAVNLCCTGEGMEHSSGDAIITGGELGGGQDGPVGPAKEASAAPLQDRAVLEIYRYGRIWRIKCTLLKNQKWSGRPHTIPLWSDIIKVHVPHFCASNLPQNCRISLLAEFWSLYDLIWVSRSWTKLRKPRRFCSNCL